MPSITAQDALALAQAYTLTRDKRIAEQKKVDEIEVFEKKLKNELMAALETLGINSVGDTKKVYSLEHKKEPTTEDWGKLYSHIQATGEFDLLYKRVNAAAVKERWDAGVQVPGVTVFPAIVLSVTKA